MRRFALLRTFFLLLTACGGGGSSSSSGGSSSNSSSSSSSGSSSSGSSSGGWTPPEISVVRSGPYFDFDERFNRYYTDSTYTPVETIYVSPTGLAPFLDRGVLLAATPIDLDGVDRQTPVDIGPFEID